VEGPEQLVLLIEMIVTQWMQEAEKQERVAKGYDAQARRYYNRQA